MTRIDIDFFKIGVYYISVRILHNIVNMPFGSSPPTIRDVTNPWAFFITYGIITAGYMDSISKNRE